MTLCLTVSGCATDGLASLPLPAPGVGSGGYTLTAVFCNALNLPAKAKVKLAGADVGELESMVARNYTAVTTLRIMDGVRVPKGSTAELRSATPLGDVFVAFKPPRHRPIRAHRCCKDGDTIGLESTTAAATVESVLSSAAILVNGGAVRNFTNIINGLGKATGDQGQAFGDLIRKTNHTLGTLNARSDQISTALTETSRLVEQLDDQERRDQRTDGGGRPGHRNTGRAHHADRRPRPTGRRDHRAAAASSRRSRAPTPAAGASSPTSTRSPAPGTTSCWRPTPPCSPSTG